MPEQKGQGLAEYAILIALITLALVVLIGAFRQAIGNVFTKVTTELNKA